MKSKIYSLRTKLFSTLLVLFFTSTSIFATDGYFSLAYDTKSKGMAGAGVAMYENSFFGNSNPASMVMHGKKFGFSLGIFNPNRDYEIKGAATPPSSWTPDQQLGNASPPFGLMEGKVESDKKFFPIPSLVANWMINENSSFAISLYGNGGMNTNYPAKTFVSPYFPPEMTGNITEPTGVNLMQMFGALTYSFKLSEKWSMGFSGIIAWQSFKAEGLQIFGNFPGFSSDPGNLTNKDASSSFGFGGKIGIQGEIVKGLYLGGTIQTQMYMSKFDDYSGLFAEQGDFDIPANWAVGIAYELVPDVFTVAFDIKQIYYGSVNSIANKMMVQAQLGANGGPGFGWEDMTVYKFGLEYAAKNDWTFRAGFSTGKNPVRSSEVMFNILAPGVINDHITFGLSKMMGDKELSIAIVHALSNTVSGANPMEFPNAQTIDLTMNQWEIEIGITF